MKELALLFLRLGAVAFGGPAAHIAMMEEEIVRRRGWMSHEEFVDLLGATNLIPGPNSTEMAIHIGYRRKGWRGLIVAGGCFILPATAVTLTLGALYARFGSMPALGPWLNGIRPAMIALIAVAVYRLARPSVKRPFFIMLGAAAAILSLAGVDEILLLLLAGGAGLIRGNRSWFGGLVAAHGPFLLPAAPAASDVAASAPTVAGLGLYFLKIGSILYGSGYVLIAFLRGGLVESRHWLTPSQLIDAVAVGQCTPGPVLSTATMIGYMILGFPGAAAATAGIFLPSFVFVALTSPFIPKLRGSKIFSGFLDGVNAGALGLMLAAALFLARTAVTGAWGVIILLAAAILMIFRNVHPAWIIAGAALAGWALG